MTLTVTAVPEKHTLNRLPMHCSHHWRQSVLNIGQGGGGRWDWWRWMSRHGTHGTQWDATGPKWGSEWGGNITSPDWGSVAKKSPSKNKLIVFYLTTRLLDVMPEDSKWQNFWPFYAVSPDISFSQRIGAFILATMGLRYASDQSNYWKDQVPCPPPKTWRAHLGYTHTVYI